MSGERSARARRARGSRLPRIAGTGVVLLLAGTGVIASLVGGDPHVTARHGVPPARVQGAHEVGLVSAGPPGPAGQAAAPAQTLLKSRSGLAFATVRQVAPEWTADQMAGGTYIFIYISDGSCLSSAALRGRARRGRASGTMAVTTRCDLGYSQRWRRQQGGTQGYWQLRNIGDGRCLTLGGASPAAGQGSFSAELMPCGAPADWHQQITFSPIY